MVIWIKERKAIITPDIVGKVVKNDGKALKRLLEKHYCFTNFHQYWDYIFEGNLKYGKILVVCTSPEDEDGKMIRITKIKIHTQKNRTF